MTNERKNLRVVTFKREIYLRVDDVADYLCELGCTEETDVRKRLEKAAENIKNIGRT